MGLDTNISTTVQDIYKLAFNTSEFSDRDSSWMCSIPPGVKKENKSPLKKI
jgi:hypothetical protein